MARLFHRRAINVNVPCRRVCEQVFLVLFSFSSSSIGNYKAKISYRNAWKDPIIKDYFRRFVVKKLVTSLKNNDHHC